MSEYHCTCCNNGLNQDNIRIWYAEGDYSDKCECLLCGFKGNMNLFTKVGSASSLRKHLRLLINTKNLADGKIPLFANQGQAMDGYSELANYRSLVEKIKKDVGYIEKKE